jgi:uncharacterized membrane protein
MHVLLIVVGLLLLLFGGGCTVISLGYLFTESRNVAQDLQDGWWILIFLGLAPLAAGWFLFRRGLAIDRAKRRQSQQGHDP